jgi:hypothetical protein
VALRVNHLATLSLLEEHLLALAHLVAQGVVPRLVVLA